MGLMWRVNGGPESWIDMLGDDGINRTKVEKKEKKSPVPAAAAAEMAAVDGGGDGDGDGAANAGGRRRTLLQAPAPERGRNGTYTARIPGYLIKVWRCNLKRVESCVQSASIQRLNPKYGKLLSNVAVNVILRRYMKGGDWVEWRLWAQVGPHRYLSPRHRATFHAR